MVKDHLAYSRFHDRASLPQAFHVEHIGRFLEHRRQICRGPDGTNAGVSGTSLRSRTLRKFVNNLEGRQHAAIL